MSNNFLKANMTLLEGMFRVQSRIQIWRSIVGSALLKVSVWAQWQTE